MKKFVVLLFALTFVFNTYAKNYMYGDRDIFHQIDVVIAEDKPEDGYYAAEFQCIAEGENSYFFIEKDLPSDKYPSENFINSLFNKFEDIFPVLTQYFGLPTDFDRNDKFIILIADIKDWFYYKLDVNEDMAPVQGYYSFELNLMDKKDFLTMDCNQPLVDAYGTMANQYFKNIFDNINPDPIVKQDRAVVEALAHYAIYLSGTIDRDSFVQWQISVLKNDFEKGKLLNPFDGTHNYFDIKNPDTHHCYAAGYLFVYYVAHELIKDEETRKRFFYTLLYEKVNSTSFDKMSNSLIRADIIPEPSHLNILYNEFFTKFLKKYFGM